MISQYKNDILFPNRTASVGKQAGKVCAVDIHTPSCQRINKGHSFVSFQADTLFSFSPPPLPEIGRREVLIIFAYF